VHSPAHSRDDDDLIARVEEFLRFHEVLIPGRNEIGPEAPDAFVSLIRATGQQPLRDGDPFDIRVEELLEGRVGSLDLVKLVGPRKLSKDSTRQLDVLLRHRPRSISLYRVPMARAPTIEHVEEPVPKASAALRSLVTARALLVALADPHAPLQENVLVTKPIPYCVIGG